MALCDLKYKFAAMASLYLNLAVPTGYLKQQTGTLRDNLYTVSFSSFFSKPYLIFTPMSSRDAINRVSPTPHSHRSLSKRLILITLT